MAAEPAEITFDVYLEPGEALSLPKDVSELVGPGHWLVSIRSADADGCGKTVRSHAAFLNSYAPEDEGLYDDYSTG